MGAAPKEKSAHQYPHQSWTGVKRLPVHIVPQFPTMIIYTIYRNTHHIPSVGGVGRGPASGCERMSPLTALAEAGGSLGVSFQQVTAECLVHRL